MICWPISEIFMLLRNVSYIDAYTTLELYNNFCGKRKFQRHEYPLYQKLVSPIKRYYKWPDAQFIQSFKLLSTTNNCEALDERNIKG